MNTTTVLLADDEPHITHVVACKLRGAGLRVIVADDGEQALEMAIEHRPDIIVTDLQMPYLSGIELAQQLAVHERTSTIPLIMLTARGYVLGTSEVENTNIRHLMSKPFSARELLQLVLGLINSQDAAQRESA